jgi:hypothetical protein
MSLIEKIDAEIAKLGNRIEQYENGNKITYGVSVGLKRAKEIILSEQKEPATDNNALTIGWIPVSERLPQLPDGKSFIPLNVTILAPSGLRNTVQMTWELKRGKPTWCYLGETSDWNVIAWQPLPEPYKGVSE